MTYVLRPLLLLATELSVGTWYRQQSFDPEAL
jgi:hypothetical protein